MMVNCARCTSKVGKSAQALKCARCTEWFHLACESLDTDDYPALTRCHRLGYLWCCTRCLPSAADALRHDASLTQTKEDLTKDVVSPIFKAIAALSERLEKLETKASTSPAAVQSFAGIVRKELEGIKSGRPSLDDNIRAHGTVAAGALPGREVLVLKPKSGVAADTNEAVKRVENALRSVPVDSCTMTKSGTLVVKLPTSKDKAEARRVMDTCFDSASDFTVIEPKKLLPKMTIVGIPASVKDEDIISVICEKSSDIGNLKNSGHQLSLIFTKAKGETKFAVLKMSPEIRKSILDQNGYVYVGLSRCKAYDRYWVTQCYHCLKFGHLATDCSRRASPPVCGFCAGEHESRTCTDKSSPCCTNCSALADVSHSVHHFASSMECPIMISQRKKVMDNTAQISTGNLKNLDHPL